MKKILLSTLLALTSYSETYASAEYDLGDDRPISPNTCTDLGAPNLNFRFLITGSHSALSCAELFEMHKAFMATNDLAHARDLAEANETRDAEARSTRPEHATINVLERAYGQAPINPTAPDGMEDNPFPLEIWERIITFLGKMSEERDILSLTCRELGSLCTAQFYRDRAPSYLLSDQQAGLYGVVIHANNNNSYDFVRAKITEVNNDSNGLVIGNSLSIRSIYLLKKASRRMRHESLVGLQVFIKKINDNNSPYYCGDDEYSFQIRFSEHPGFQQFQGITRYGPREIAS